ncbi:hypothetical protein J4405_01330 [Candidatus Woesearchaeota archaeon]|nr:hypothetical protein [Candidatus Woesearchaeota archaeon]
MKKEKIAISLDSNLLQVIDSYVDNDFIRSRSQAIESLLNESIKNRPLLDAVMLIHENSLDLLNKNLNGLILMQHHLNFLEKNGVKKLYLITKENPKIKEIISKINHKILIELVYEKEHKGNALALSKLKEKIKGNFLVFNGDTLNNFNLKNMLNEFLKNNKIMYMGLINSSSPSKYGSVVLDGNLVINFKEKKKTNSYIINAGVYLFREEIFSYLNQDIKSLEKDLFPILAKNHEIIGFFTFGEYLHLPESF